MLTDVCGTGGRTLKFLLVLAVLLTVGIAAAAVVSPPRALANPPAQVTNLPDCTYKIQPEHDALPVKEMPKRLEFAHWLAVSCKVKQDAHEGWGANTELHDPKWTVGGRPFSNEKSISVPGDFIPDTPGEGLVIELVGHVPAKRLDVVASQDENPGDAIDTLYTMQTAPPQMVLVISLTDRKTGEIRHKVNVDAIHQLATEVEKAVDEINSFSVAKPIAKRAEELNNEGRPWAALDMLQSTKSVLDEFRRALNRERLVFGLGGLCIGALGIVVVVLVVVLASRDARERIISILRRGSAQ